MRVANQAIKLQRRRFLGAATGIALSAAVPSSQGGLWHSVQAEEVARRKKSVAAVVTIYRRNSHADVLLGKILEGWNQDGGAGPQLILKSLYVDQFPPDDLSVKLANEHGFKLCTTIEEAIALGTCSVAVDGVISVGEHGDYPTNAMGQHLYPRRRFFEGITNTFAKYDKSVPVFNDKHPGPELSDALWMAKRARELGFPWMAGSSLPVGYRTPDVTLPLGSELEAAVAVGYSGLDVYGFHTLDSLQCIIERRAGGELGVRSVQSLPLKDIQRVIADNRIDTATLNAALASCGTALNALLEFRSKEGAIFVIQYRDGLTVPVFMLPGLATSISVAFKQRSCEPLATRFEERVEPRYPHFAYLLKGIEQMIHTGKAAYPVERTLLTSGILDRALTSRSEGGRRIETPELAIAYSAVGYPHAPHIDLLKQF